jgi:hypothetical protein
MYSLINFGSLPAACTRVGCMTNFGRLIDGDELIIDAPKLRQHTLRNRVSSSPFYQPQTELFKTFVYKFCCKVERSGVFSGLKCLFLHVAGCPVLKAGRVIQRQRAKPAQKVTWVLFSDVGQGSNGSMP